MFNDSIDPQRLADCLAVTTMALGLAPHEIIGVEPQTGGLFNFLLRVETGSGTYFFKQYLDDVPNPIYDPPKIPARVRAELASRVQRLAAEATKGGGTAAVPEIVHFDADRAAFLMARAAGDEPLNDLLSRGERTEAFMTELPRVLAALHQFTYGRYEPDSIFGNTTFRDFKLGMQYDDITGHLASSEAARVVECRDDYQKRTYCVTHGDINSRNIITSASALGVIDFEQSHLGTPAYDLSYILCELLISMEAFGEGNLAGAVIAGFLDQYFKHFTADSRESVETEMTPHLAVQTLYRFWGPSRVAWTFYVNEADSSRIIDRARALLMSEGPVTSLLKVV